MSWFAANAVRLQLHALAYNLGNFMRTLALPEKGQALVADEPQGKTRQDRCEDRDPCPLRHIPDGRSRGARPRLLFAEILHLIRKLRPKLPPAPT